MNSLGGGTPNDIAGEFVEAEKEQDCPHPALSHPMGEGELSSGRLRIVSRTLRPYSLQ
jgi:hypothetical protein